MRMCYLYFDIITLKPFILYAYLLTFMNETKQNKTKQNLVHKVSVEFEIWFSIDLHLFSAHFMHILLRFSPLVELWR